MSGIRAAVGSILAAVTQREFLTAEQIKDFVRLNRGKLAHALYPITPYTNESVLPDDLRAMLIFVADKQQTWLVADALAAYCVLDDRSREEPRVLWETSLAEALPAQATDLRGKNLPAQVGILRLGKNPNEWMYSKNLFAYKGVEDAVTRFLSDSDL